MPSNPFHIRGSVKPEGFIGRDAILDEILDDLYLANGVNSYGIVGGHLFGRSSLLHVLEDRLVKKLRQDLNTMMELRVLPVYIGLNGVPQFTEATDVIGFILHKLCKATCPGPQHVPLFVAPPLELDLPIYTSNSSSSANIQELEAHIWHIVSTAYEHFGELRIVLLIDDADKILDFPWTGSLFGNLNYLISDGDVRQQVRIVMAGSKRYMDISPTGSWLRLVPRFLAHFTTKEAERLFSCVQGMSDEVVQEVLVQSGGHPYLLQYFLYYLFSVGTTLGNMALVTMEHVRAQVNRFQQENISTLEGWWIKIGEDGQRVYCIMRHIESWVTIADICRETERLGLQIDADSGLKALASHGVIVLDEAYLNGLYRKKYQIHGHLFRTWSESHCQAIVQSSERIVKEDTMIDRNTIVYHDQQTAITNELAKIIARHAASSPSDPKDFFRKLVFSLAMPEEWSWQIISAWSTDVEYNAQQLIRWAWSKGTFPPSQFTLLGNLLYNFLDRYVGRNDEARIVAAVIVSYPLCLNEELRNQIAIRYRVPQVIDLGKPTVPVDDIAWRGPLPENDTELQAKLPRKLPRLEMEFLKGAVEQVGVVCRIDLAKKNRQGTGFLIARDLVLTNYHVLKRYDDEDIEVNAHEIRLCFGYTTRDSGQTFKLAKEKPILQSSPTEELDFVLLQVEEKITRAEGIKIARYNLKPLSQGMGMNIIQHPNGETMQIAMSSNGIINIYQHYDVVQYIADTIGGSSGAPCFNEDWEVVALHHAEKAKLFGSAGEGILFSAIYEKIKDDLLSHN